MRAVGTLDPQTLARRRTFDDQAPTAVRHHAGAPDRTFGSASDTELARALRTRSNEALDEAFSRHGSLVARTVRTIAGGNYVDDVVQDVFLLLWRAPERFDPERGSLASYLALLTRGTTLDHLRSDAARQRRHRDHGFRPGPVHEVDDAAIAGITATEIHIALRALPMTERVAIELAFFGGDTYRQVAAKLGEPEGTIKSRIRTGLRRLEAALTGIGVPESD